MKTKKRGILKRKMKTNHKKSKALEMLARRLSDPDEFLELLEDMVPEISPTVRDADHDVASILSESSLIDKEKAAKLELEFLKKRSYDVSDDEDENDDDEEDEEDDEEDDSDEVKRNGTADVIYILARDVREDMLVEAKEACRIVRKRFYKILKSKIADILVDEVEKPGASPLNKIKVSPKKRITYVDNMPGKL